MVIYHLLMHKIVYGISKYAGVAELADAPDLGSGVPDVQVQVLSPALVDKSYIKDFKGNL